MSACLLGKNCKYNGGNNRHASLIDALAAHEVVPVCPEQLGGLPTPRPRSEILAGAVVNECGASVDAAFRLGAERAWEAIGRAGGCDVAILQPRSPSCGTNRIYDGTFSGVLVQGDGVFVSLLRAHGVPVMEPDAFVASWAQPSQGGSAPDA